MKRAAFDIGPVGGGVQKALVKEAVMPNQYGAAATVLLHGLAYGLEYPFQGGFFRDGAA